MGGQRGAGRSLGRVLGTCALAVVLGAGGAVEAAEGRGAATVVSRADLPLATAFEDASAPVQAVEIAGVTAYTAADLVRFAIAYEHQSLGRSTLAGTARAIEAIYREDGYLLAEARASLDAQTGRLAVEVTEGYVEQIRIEGFRPTVARQIEGCFRRLLGVRPLRNAEFERAFMLASDLSGVYLRSEFSYEPSMTGAVLRVSGTEARAGGSLTVDSVPLRPRYAGRSYVVQEARGLARGGDMLRAVGVLTLEPRDSHALGGTVFYRIPAFARGTYVEAFVGNAFSRRTFGQIGARSELLGVNAAVALGRAFRRDLHDYAYGIGEYEYSDASSRLGSASFDSTSHAVRGYYVQGHTSPDGGLAQWTLELSAGQRPDRPSGQAPDGVKRFAHVRGSFGSVTALPFISTHTYLRVESSMQYASSALPLVEKFGLGFQPHLRGYAPYEVEGDRGIGTAVELSNLRPVSSGPFRELMPFVFFDAGAVGSEEPSTGAPATRTLASAGAGVRVATVGGVSAGLFVGVPLKDGPLSDKGDPSVYLRLTKGWGQ